MATVIARNALSNTIGDCVDYIAHSELENLRAAAKANGIPEIKDVIYNPPATIIKWADGTQTTVKTEDGTEYDPEVGFFWACGKKLFGNDGTFKKMLGQWCDVESINESIMKRNLCRQKRQLKKMEKQVAEMQADVNNIDLVDAGTTETNMELHAGDRVVMFQHIDECNREYEPEIGTIGTVMNATNYDAVWVKWPENSIPNKNSCEWMLPTKSVRRVTK